MAIAPNSITFVNHASVLIRGRDKAVLCDPWYSGDAFHKGWRLLHENPDEDIAEILGATTHLWISHEHPDHFAIGFFKKYKTLLQERQIPILFQQTKDKRVEGFLRKEGFPLIILPPNKRHELEPGFTVRVAPDEFYDSALLIELNGTRIFNVNDCTLHSHARVAAFHQQHGDCDVLLTQFSYAAWKGGRDNTAWRQEAARDKLATLRDQGITLNAKLVIPFASFVRFANVLNSYLNDAVNTPDMVLADCRAHNVPFNCLFLRPMESVSLGSLRAPQNEQTLAFWRDAFLHAMDDPTAYSTSHDLQALQPLFAKYLARLKQKNDFWLMKLIARLPLLHAFAPLTIQLLDTQERLRLDIPNQTLTATRDPADVAMHSESLAFMFQNSFGFDTLTVNGTFEESRPGGFTAMTKNFAVENLNNLGYELRPALAFNVPLITLCFRRLIGVAKRLKPNSSEPGEPAMSPRSGA